MASTHITGPLYVGGYPVGADLPGPGQAYFLDPANGNDTNDGKTIDRAFKTLAVAEDALTANQHDVLYYIAGSSSISLSATLTWDKSYTHLIGVCAPSRAGQRARIFQTATATALSPLINVTASGCIFKNLYVFQGVDDVTSLLDVQVTGSRNYFYNVHFAGGGHATQAVDGGASLKLSGASENFFEDCTIGVDTVAAGTGMVGLLYAATGGAARNVFRNCRFTMKAGHAGAAFVELGANAGIDRYQLFEDCQFINLAATAMTTAFVIPADFDANDKRFLMHNCVLLGATDWDSADRGGIFMDKGTITGGGNAGILVVSAAT